MGFREGKRGQLAIFVVIAIIIIAGVGIYFLVANSDYSAGIPAELEEVYGYYQGCFESVVGEGVQLAGLQGGKLYSGEFEPGNAYAPFSSELNFLGLGVPYWYYVSGNGLIKDKAPTKASMQNEIADYIDDRVLEVCDRNFELEGYDVSFSYKSSRVVVNDEDVQVDINADVRASKGEISANKGSFGVERQSRLGVLYNLAREIYAKEKQESFLENYAVDVLRLYAPVTGVELSCSPKTWQAIDVFDDLREALQLNTQNLRLQGNYYEIEEQDKYFVVPIDARGATANFIYFEDWPTKFEVVGEGVSSGLMIAQPVGNEAGLGVLGFCYAPYHFVYDLAYPVMIQLNYGEEVFQFPMVVVIDNNLAREGASAQLEYEESYDLCEYKTQELQVNLYDANLNKVDANLSYSCFEQNCYLGESEGGVLESDAPACVNGLLEVYADGYATNRQFLSTNEQTQIEVILSKEYEVEVDLRHLGDRVGKQALITFEGLNSKSIIYPSQNKVKLSEGQYNISVYVYSNSSITLSGSTKRQCVDVPSSGFLGLFGSTKQECYDINIPGGTIEQALTGGGREEHYILEDMLKDGKLEIRIQEFSEPKSIEQIQYNYEAFNNAGVDIE